MAYILDAIDNYHFVVIPDKIAESLLINNNKRVIYKIASEKVHCMLNKTVEHGFVVYVNNQIVKRLKLSKKQKIDFSIQIDDTPYQCEMPEEFQEVLNTDTEADKIFHSLTPGNMRSILFMILKFKSVDKRIEISLKVANMLKQGITKAPEMMKKN